MCFLAGTLPNGSRFCHELAPGRTTIGRFALSTIRLEEESISPLHAEIIALGERRYLLRDLHSQHGIAVDGHEVFEEEITAPCRLSFGQLTCELQLERVPLVAAPPKVRSPKGTNGTPSPSPSLPHARQKARPTSPNGHKAPRPPSAPGVAPVQIQLPKAPRPVRQGAPPPKPEEVDRPGALPEVPSLLPSPAAPRPASLRSWPRRRMAWAALLLLALAAGGLWVESRSAAARHAPSFLARLVGSPVPEAPAPRKAFLANLPPSPPVAPPSPTPIGARLPAPATSESPAPALVSTTPPADPAPAPPVAPAADSSLAPKVNPLASASMPISRIENAAVASLPSPPAEPISPPAPVSLEDPSQPAPAPETAPPLDSPAAQASVVEPPAAPLGELMPGGAPLVKVSGESASSAEAAPEIQPAAPVPAPENASASSEQKSDSLGSLATAPLGEKSSWRLLPPGRNVRWDASNGALLASNDWKMNARQMMEAGPAPDADASSRVVSWYFGSSQPEETGDLARLTSKPEAPVPPPPRPIAVATEKVSVMILGDSLALCGFGSHLDRLFRAAPNIKATNTYMACGTVPMSWLKEGIFANLKTYCGFWSIEQPESGKKPLNFQDTYGMGRGKPKAHPVPKLEDLFARAEPEVLVLQTGTNLFSLFQDGKTVIPARHAPMLRAQIQPFLAKLLKLPHPPRALYWVASPTSGRVSPEVQEFVLAQVRAQLGPMATIIDSRTLVSYPYRHPEPDHEHFIGEDMDHWADGVYALIQKDLAAHGLPVALARPPGFEEKGSVAKGHAEKETQPAQPVLQVTARLVHKSPPLTLNQLNVYNESTAAFLYEVETVEAGEYPDKQIIVMHPAHIGKKLQPDVAKLKVGKSYKLHLRELDGSLWNTTKTANDTGLLDLLPYVRVEDEARFPSNNR